MCASRTIARSSHRDVAHGHDGRCSRCKLPAAGVHRSASLHASTSLKGTRAHPLPLPCRRAFRSRVSLYNVRPGGATLRASISSALSGTAALLVGLVILSPAHPIQCTQQLVTTSSFHGPRRSGESPSLADVVTQTPRCDTPLMHGHS
ncbi:hypothetical protein OH76DRAFT_1404029 [Lentinus brumalis]|uniref:Uncharacterized protein n=1 Tax=Lentinus brumalis TaxID=2498619 RepID=A0A371D9D1_9APHY|nr:hypothetical protein OH76DRAFT_1404029 [Polyporus brumalis]